MALLFESWSFDECKSVFYQHLQPPFKPPSTNKVKSVFLIVFEHKGKREYMYWLARQRDQAEKDVQQVRTGNVLASQESALSRWKEYFKELVNEDIRLVLNSDVQICTIYRGIKFMSHTMTLW